MDEYVRAMYIYGNKLQKTVSSINVYLYIVQLIIIIAYKYNICYLMSSLFAITISESSMLSSCCLLLVLSCFTGGFTPS